MSRIYPDCAFCQELFNHLIKLIGYSSKNKEQDPAKRYSKAKHPLEKGWKEKSITIEEAEKWIEQGGWIGCVVPKGYILVDIDNKELGEKLDRLLSKHLTFISIETPKGYQFIFKDSGLVEKQQARFLCAGPFPVDYRLAGKGYFVFPTENTEGRCFVRIPEKLEDISPLPLIFVPLRSVKPEDEGKFLDIPIPVGNRNNTLFKVATRVRELVKLHRPDLLDKFELQEFLLELCKEINQFFCETPLEEEEVEKIVKSAIKQGEKEEEKKQPEEKKKAPKQNSQETQKSRQVIEIIPAQASETNELLEALKQRYDELTSELSSQVNEDTLWSTRESIYALPAKLLEFGGVKLTIGSSRSGKSYFMVNLACVYAKGEGEVLGVPFTIPKPLKVLYLALDEQEDIVRRKVREYLSKEEYQELKDKGLLTFVFYYRRLKDYESLLSFEKFISSYDVVIIDMLNDLYLPPNMAVASQMNWWFLNYFRLLCRQKQNELTIFVLDHTAVRPNAVTMEEKARGGNALVGKAVDLILLEAKKDNTLKLNISSRYTGRYELKCYRDPENGKIYVDETAFAETLSSKETFQEFVSEGKTKDLIIAYFIVHKNEPARIQDIVTRLGLDRDTVKSVLRRNPDVFVPDPDRSTKNLYYYKLHSAFYDVAKTKEIDKFQGILDLFFPQALEKAGAKKTKKTTPTTPPEPEPPQTNDEDWDIEF